MLHRPEPPLRPATLRAIRLFYFMCGIGVSVWALVVPFAKVRFHLGDGTLGLILLAPGLGGIAAMQVTALVTARFGSRVVLGGCAVVFSIMMALLSSAPNPLVLTMFLFIFGAAFGGIDISMNAQAVLAEGRSGRLLMSGFHGLYSVGGLTAALLTGLLLKAGVSHAACGVLSALTGFGVLTQWRYLLPKADDVAPQGRHFAWPGKTTILLGACCFVCFLTEGAVTDWSAVFLRFSRGLDLSSAGFGYAGFSVMMAASRLMGDRLSMRLGEPAVLRLGCMIAAAGLLTVVACPAPAAAMLGFGLVGFGVGNIAPLIFGAAARVPGVAPHIAVPAVITLGYTGFLLGPVAIGFIAHATSLGFAFALDGGLLVMLLFGGNAVRRLKTR